MGKQVGCLFPLFQAMDDKTLSLVICYLDGDKGKMRKDQNDVMIGNRCWYSYHTRRKYVLQMSYFSPICYNENGHTNTWIAITNNKYCISIIAWDLSRSYWKKRKKFSPIRQVLSWLGYYVCCCMRIFSRNIKK